MGMSLARTSNLEEILAGIAACTMCALLHPDQSCLLSRASVANYFPKLELQLAIALKLARLS